jgi:hypothetical protein
MATVFGPLLGLSKFSGSPFSCRSSFSKHHLTQQIFCHVFFKFAAPQGLKGTAASIQGVNLGKISIFAFQVTPLDLIGGDSRVILHRLA